MSNYVKQLKQELQIALENCPVPLEFRYIQGSKGSAFLGVIADLTPVPGQDRFTLALFADFALPKTPSKILLYDKVKMTEMKESSDEKDLETIVDHVFQQVEADRA